MEPCMWNCLYWALWTLPSYWKSGNWTNKIMQHQGYSTQTTSGIMAHWHKVWQSRKIHHLSHEFAKYYFCRLKMKKVYSCIKSPVNNLHSSSFQLSMLDHTYQYCMGKQRISIVPACIKSIPHMPFLDDHSTCITRKYGETMEVVYQTDDTHASTIIVSSTEALSSSPTIVRTWRRTQHSKQHLHLLSATDTGSNSILKKEPSFNRIPVSSKCMKRSLLPFLGDALSWLTGTATTKDVNTIKTRINHLITTQQN